MKLRTAWLVLMMMLTCALAHAQEKPERRAVPKVLDQWLELGIDADHSARLPIHTSLDWSQPQPGVLHALIVVHGLTRDDLDRGEAALAKIGDAGSDYIVVTPQFLINEDVAFHQLPESTLRWGIDDWKEGSMAKGPQPVSSYTAMDTIFRQLLDRHLFPNLQRIVLAGHSAGGQFVQRYALIGRGAALSAQAGVSLRFVVANPSSYAYKDEKVPTQADAEDATHCDRLGRWPYALKRNLPRYANRVADAQATMQAYARQDLIYLIGAEDRDPAHPMLDKSCAAEAQGPQRNARGRNYFVYAASFAPPGEFTQRLYEVPKVGHNSRAMFTSSCGLAALFDVGQCQTELQLAALQTH